MWTLPNSYFPESCFKMKKTEIFIFTLLCGVSKGFIKVFKAFIKPFEASQRSVKIKISVNFFSASGIGTGRVKRTKVLLAQRKRVSLKLSACSKWRTCFESMQYRPKNIKIYLGPKILSVITYPSQKLKKRLLNNYGSNIFVTNEMNETSLHFFLFISTAVRLTFPKFFNLQLFIKKMHCYKELIENVSERVTYDFWMRCWNTKSWYNECWRHINSTSWSHGYHR